MFRPRLDAARNHAYATVSEAKMSVRLNITMDENTYRELKRQVRPKGLSGFINEAVRARLRPDAATLDASYAAASQDRVRQELAVAWDSVEIDGWPE